MFHQSCILRWLRRGHPLTGLVAVPVCPICDATITALQPVGRGDRFTVTVERLHDNNHDETGNYNKIIAD